MNCLHCQTLRLESSVRQLMSDLVVTKRQYQDAVEESGRLEARIQTFTSNAQSEQDMLSGEVKRRDEAIQRLKQQQMILQETVSKQEEKVLLLNYTTLYSLIDSNYSTTLYDIL